MLEAQKMIFISPVMPDPGGGGREMRAHAWLQHFKKEYEIHLIVNNKQCHNSEKVNDHILSVNFAEPLSVSVIGKFSALLLYFLRMRKIPPIPHSNKINGDDLARLKTELFAAPVKCLFIFRAGMIELGFKFQDFLLPEKTILDLDDIESATHKSIALLRLRKGFIFSALKEFLRCLLYRYLERNCLKQFNSVFVCSESDKDYLFHKYSLTNVIVQMNRISSVTPLQGSPRDTTNFLFIGTLGYFPNEEAVDFIIDRIIPLIRQSAEGSIKFLIAGRNARPRLISKMSMVKEVEFLGELQHVEDAYRNTDFFLAPLHAGGGTKIKILEAFMFNKPVIASSESVKGLPLLNGKHYLLANTPGQFASACMKISKDSNLALRLQKNASQWIHENNLIY